VSGRPLRRRLQASHQLGALSASVRRVSASIAIGVSVAAAIISVFSLYYGRRQALAAERQTTALGQQLQQAELARRDSLEPHVVVDIRPRAPGSVMLGLFVTNIGATTARDVRIEVDPPLRSSYGAMMEDNLTKAVSRPISTLASGRVLMWNMDTASGLVERADLPRLYRFTVHASGPFGPLEPVSSVIDLEVLLGTSSNAETIEGLLEKTVKSVDALANAISNATASTVAAASVPVTAPRGRIAGRKRRRRTP